MHSPQRSLKLERKGRLLYIEVTEEEDKFREKKFSDVNKVLKEDIACSTCGVDLKYNVKEGNDLSYHPYLKVLMCEGCKERYSRCSFPVDEEGDQKCCSWCGREGTLYYCSKCSCAFCKKCIKANFGKEKLKDLVDKELVCYICDPKPLYECRAICYAAIECARSRKRKKIAAQKLKVNEMAEKKRLGIKPGRLGRRRATNSDNADCDIEVIISSDDESNNSDLPLNSQRPVSTQKSAMKLGKLKSHPLEKITKDLVRESSGDLTDSDFEPKNSQRLKPCLLKTGRKSKDSGSDSSRKYKDRAVPNSANMNEVCKEKKSDTVPLSRPDTPKNPEWMTLDTGPLSRPDTPKNPEWMILDSHAEDISCVAMSLHERISSFRTKFVAQNWEQNMLPVAVDRLMSYIKRSVQSLLDVQDGLESLSGSSFNISEQKKNTDVTQRTKNFEKSLCDRVKDKETESEGIESDDVHEPKKLQRCGSTESEGECSNGVGDPPENLLISEPGNDLPSDTEIAKETNDNSVAAIMNSSCDLFEDEDFECNQDSNAGDIENQDDMFENQNDIFENHDDIFENQNDFVENQDDIVENQDNICEIESLPGVKGPQSSKSLACKAALMADSSSDSDCDLKPNSSNSHSAGREGSSDDEDLCLKPSVRPHKKTRFDIRELDVYKSDVKLQGKWTVNIEKLPPAEENRLFESVGSYYDNDADSEDASQSDNSVDNLINLNNLKRKAKGSDEDRNKISKSETDTKKKAVKKQEEKLADFLNRSSGPSDAEVSFEDQPLMRFLDKEKDTNSLNDAKKKLLLQSSDSEDNVPDVNEADEKPKQETSVPKKKKNLESQTSKNGGEDIASSSDNENDSDKKKSAWRKDKLLTGKLSDTDTSEEERRLEKRKEKEKEKEKNSSSEDEIFTPKQRKSFETQKKSEPKTETDSDGDTSDDFVKKKRKVLRKKSSSSSSSESEKEKPKKKRRRIKVANSSSDEDEDDKKKTAENDSPTKGRKKIRHMIKEEELEQGTKEAAKEEEERRERIAARQKLYEEIYDGIQKGFEVLDQLVLDFDEETKEPLVEVDKSLVKKLKPHQAKGVKFMWDACFESLKRIERSKGSGCILAHCMGLGKTFQVVTLVHTLFKHPETLVKNVLVVCPVSTVLNWVNEFSKWLQGLEDGPEIEVFELIRCKQNMDRSYRLREWRAEGGVMIMGYDMYRNLTNPASRRARASHMKTFQECLVDPGPDLVICDEGHLLKNEDTGISKAMTRIKTLRRIILTGTPLQNNLKEYHCMVQFVKPNLLGTRKEFLNRFVNPITNGQYEDSTAHDVKRMKRRAHVLHQTLEGSVQRYDYSVLTPFLPPKEEYVISIRISDVQEKLYRHYLEHYSSRGYQGKGAQLFADFQSLQRIWTHPRVLKMSAERAEQKAEKEDDEDSEGSLRDFIDDGDASDSNTSESSSASSGNDDDVVCLSDDSQKGKKKPEEPKPGRRTRSNKTEEIAEPEPSAPSKSKEWWEAFIEESDLDDLRASPKLQMLFSILKDTEENGEKLLVFSQSLYSLDIIEYFLGKIDEATQSGKGSELVDGHTGSWSPGIDYFRLDGSTPTEQRSIWCNIFNKTTNLRARLFLISTRAGGLGINLVAANRVVIFDASWNPSHDLQSIFRIYRFGQKNPCFIYRFLAQGTMEEKIYERQVTKLSLAGRVVDEHQIERYYKMADLQELYQFTPADRSSYEPPKLPKDHLFAEILKKHATIIVKYHEHDSLLENKEEEELNEEERAAAWDDYEKEKKGPVNQPPQVPGTEALPSLEQVEQLLRTRHPDKSDEQIKIDAALTLKQAMEQQQRIRQEYFMRIQAMQQLQLQKQQQAFQQQQQQAVAAYAQAHVEAAWQQGVYHNYDNQRFPQPFPGIQGYQSRMNMPSHSRYVYPQPAPNTQPNFLRKL